MLTSTNKSNFRIKLIWWYNFYLLFKALNQLDKKTQHPISISLPKWKNMWKYFQNSACNFRVKWEINLAVCHTVSYLPFNTDVWIFLWHGKNITARKLSVFGVFRVRIFLHSDWIRTRKNSEYGHNIDGTFKSM